MNYLFDIDGTLTPSRQSMDPEFKRFFLNWIKNKKVYLITGSDYDKSLEQVGIEVLNSIDGYFNNAGNVGYIKGKEIYRNDWDPPEDLIKLLKHLLNSSTYPIRAGKHFEYRIGMLNFSIVGRNCSLKERKNYYKYDRENKERQKLCQVIMEKFPKIDVTIGGEISIDINPKNMDKSQIIEKVDGLIHFFGDRTEKGGNDYKLAIKLRPPHLVTAVTGWQNTMEILKNI